jgi:galactose mutarotase-like enzyme
MHQIENNYLRIKAREYGGELTSLFDKINGIEHLWQAHPEFWPWHAPVLFPVIGRCLNDELVIEGQKYRMEKHGFARKSEFKLLELAETKMVFSLKSNPQLKRIYPFDFEFLIRYHLSITELVVSYEVINRDSKPIYFQLGGHPAFAVPFKEGENYSDYYLQFEQNENVSRHYINDEGYFDGRQDVSLANSGIIHLNNNLFRDDALIFKDLKSRKVTIKGKDTLHYLSVNFTGFNYLGLWAKVGAPYVCIEPWLGCADTANKPVEFKDKEGVIQLAANEHFTVSFAVQIG